MGGGREGGGGKGGGGGKKGGGGKGDDGVSESRFSVKTSTEQ